MKRIPCGKSILPLVRSAVTCLPLLLLLPLPATVQAQFIYATNSGTITIAGYTGPGGDVNIPDTINGLPVTSIGEHAFSWRTSLTSVTIPDSVTSIRAYAFGNCTSLTNVTIPDSVTRIEGSAFNHCWSLTSITIPNSVTSIGEGAFYYCTSLTNVTIPDSVTRIGEYAFESCINVTSVTIGNSVTGIGEYAFRYCTGVTNVTIGKRVTSTGFGAFWQCNSLASVTIPDSITSIDDWAFYGCSSLTSVSIPNGVTNIGGGAFSSCTSLASVVIPNSITRIGWSAFSGCTSLTSVTIPSSVTNILGWFDGCTSLTSITVDALNPVYSSVDGVLLNKSQTTLILYPGGKAGSFTVPDNVTSIGERAFWRCTRLTRVTIGNSVTGIGEYAFWQCTSLTSVAIGNSVTNIGVGAFYECTSLTNITLPNSVTSIGGSAFYGCWSLTAVYFQGNAPSVGSNAFGGNNVTVYYSPGTTGWGRTFGDRPAMLWTPEVPCGYEVTNSTINITKYLGSNGVVTIPSTINGLPVASIGNEAFSGCTSLTSITIPNSVTSIGDGAFNYCTSLTSVTIPDSVANIGNYTFSGCSSLTAIVVDALNSAYSSVAGVLFNKSQTTLIHYPWGKAGSYTIPNSVTSIGGAFSGCTSLTSITIPNSITSIGDGAFNYCSSLTNITIPDSVTNIGNYAFYYCSSLTSVTIGNSVTSIGNEAFSGCTSLTSITIPNSVTSIEWGAFSGCTSLAAITVDALNSAYSSVDGVLFNKSQTTLLQCPLGKVGSFTVPNTVTSIGGAFSGCTDLTSVTIGNSVTCIDDWAFSGCTSLSNVTIPDSVTNIGNYTFSGCSSLSSATIPNSVTSIGEWAFSGCTSLISVTIPNSVTSIGDYAFAWTGLASVTIPSSVTSVGNYTFSGSSTLTAITVDGLNPNYSSLDGVLFDKSQTTLIQCPLGKAGSFVIPNSVTNIGDQAFSSCTSLTNVTIGNSVTSIGDGVFSGCSGLTSVTIPNSVNNIGHYTFSGCTSLTNVTIPNSVTRIGQGAFSGCTSLTSVAIPNSVTSIEWGAFGGCTSLTAITVDALNSIYSSLDGVLFNKSQTTLIQFPGGKAGSYTVPNSVISIEGAFSGCTSLTSVTIPGSITIYSGTFSGCTSLASITMDARNPNYSSVDGVLFNKSQTTLILCPEGKAGSITVPSSVTSIEWGAFSGCTSLTSIAVDAHNPNYSSVDGVLLDKSQTTIIQYPGGKDGSYIVPNSVPSIGGGAFYGCTSLTSVTIPESVTSIEWGAFGGCTSLTSITVDAHNTNYSSADGVLFDKSQATIIQYPWGKAGGYTVPDTVTGLGSAFRDCSRLTSVTIPNSVTWIEHATFHGCTSLTEVYFQGNTPSFSPRVPALGNEDGTTVYYLPGSKGWGKTFDGLPTALWLPKVETSDGSFGVWADQFGFTINWTSGMTVVVEASTSLATPSWVPLETHTFKGDSWYFSDAEWTNYPSRFYRIRSP